MAVEARELLQQYVDEERGVGGSRTAPAVLEQDPYFWHFPQPLEREYAAFRARDNIPVLRLSIFMSFLLYTSYLGYDAITAGNLDFAWIYACFFFICAPVSASPLIASYLSKAELWVPRMAMLTAVVNSVILTGAVIAGEKLGVPVPYEALIVQLLYEFFLLGLMARLALPIAGASVLAYVLGSALVGVPEELLFHRSFFLVGCLILGGVACFLQERAQRESWLRARRLRELSERDALTGLLNHRVFFARGEALMRQAQRDGKPVALMIGDVDHFKSFNDTYGHLAGDDCLRQVGEVLRIAGRRPLDMAARLGGEEFALLLYDAPNHWAVARADQLRQEVAALGIEHQGMPLNLVTISMGVACVGPQEGSTLETLVGRADAAMYRAKASGRNSVSL